MPKLCHCGKLSKVDDICSWCGKSLENIEKTYNQEKIMQKNSVQ